MVGLTTAYALKQRGFDVVLLEQRFLGFGASGRNAGSIWVQTAQAGPELELARRGVSLYESFIDDLGPTFEFHKSGGVFFFETEQQRSLLDDYVADRRAHGIKAEFIDADEARRLSPTISDRAIGAVFSPDDAQINATKFTRALGDAARRAGVRIYENTAVLGISRQGDSVAGVHSVRGQVSAGGVVWAAGAWAENLITDGITLPVTPVRVGLLTTQPVPFKSEAIAHGPLGAHKSRALSSLPRFARETFEPTSVVPADDGPALSYEDVVVQNADGSLLLGHTFDAAGSLNPHITMSATRLLLETILRRRPEYGSLGVTGLWAGLVGFTPDELPIIDSVNGLFINTGHSFGTASAPFAGELMAQLVAGEATSMPLAPFSASRPALQPIAAE